MRRDERRSFAVPPARSRCQGHRAGRRTEPGRTVSGGARGDPGRPVRPRRSRPGTGADRGPTCHRSELHGGPDPRVRGRAGPDHRRRRAAMTAARSRRAPAKPQQPDPEVSAWTADCRRARLHVITGKGGTGKTTVAAALALASNGRRVLLVEVEERQGIARLFDVPPLPYEERKVAIATGGGEVRALCIDVEAALLEYFAMFYNLGFAGRSLKKMGAVEFATTLAPGLRDVLLTGKVKETVTRRGKDNLPVYDDVVMDAPPTGRVVTFLGVTEAMSDLAKRGPIHSQAEGVVRLLHSPDTIVHLVTLLEDMPVTETLEAIAHLRETDLPVGTIIINAATERRLPT